MIILISFENDIFLIYNLKSSWNNWGPIFWHNIRNYTDSGRSVENYILTL